MNLVDIYNDFITEKKSYCEPKTIQYYEENLTRFINYIGEHAPDGRPDKSNYINYITLLRNSGIKNTSIRTYCRAIKVFTSWMNDNGYIESDFTNKVKLPRNDSNIIMPLSQKEVDSIDNYIINVPFPDFLNLRNILIIHLMLDAGLRKSEVLNLKIDDLDFENKSITIHNSKYNKSRVIPMSSVIWNYANSYIYESNEIFNHDIKGNLILKEDNLPVSSDTIKNIFRKYKKSIGIERLHPHLLRHTFATSYLMQGGNLEQLRIFLGHSDYNVTRNYLHLAASNKLIDYDYYKLDSNILK